MFWGKKGKSLTPHPFSHPHPPLPSTPPSLKLATNTNGVNLEAHWRRPSHNATFLLWHPNSDTIDIIKNNASDSTSSLRPLLLDLILSNLFFQFHHPVVARVLYLFLPLLKCNPLLGHLNHRHLLLLCLLPFPSQHFPRDHPVVAQIPQVCLVRIQ